MPIFVKPNFSDTALITRYKLLLKIGRWRVYEVRMVKKKILLLVDHKILSKYRYLHRLTDYKFIGLSRKELSDD